MRHGRTGRAFIVVRGADGKRRQVALGPWGSSEAQRRYHAELAKWYAHQRGGEEAAALVDDAPGTLTIAGACARWLLFCERYYRHVNGSPTSELRSCRYAVAPLLELHADLPLDAFTPKVLKATRERMVRGDPRVPADKRRGWSRPVVNKAVNRLRAMVKWCVAEGFTSATTHAALCAVAPLKRGRTDAREPAPNLPAPAADVEKTLPFLPPVVADMVALQNLVGMRGGELCSMVTAELDRSEAVHPGCWIFTPRHSKLSYRGRVVEYVLGPKAVAIVRKYLRADPEAPLFSPADSERRRLADMRARRRSPVQPSQLDRRKSKPERRPGPRYDSTSYGHAVRQACLRAGVPPWSPHDLRRAVASRVRAAFGIEAARAVLAHETVEMSELYSRKDLGLAAQVAAKIG